MKLKTLLTVTSVYMALAGLGLIFFPTTFGIGAVPADASDSLIAFLRLWGSPLLGIAVMNWLTRNAKPSKTLNAIIFGNLVGFAIIALLDIWGSFGGGRPTHKVFVVIHLLFAIAFIWIGKKNFWRVKNNTTIE